MILWPSNSRCPTACNATRALIDPGPYGLIGKKVPDFQLADMQGKAWSSQALAGKVVALHLWRSNAEACLPVIPALQQAYDKFKSNDKVAVWAINLDSSQVEAKTIEETARQWKLSVPILRDPDLETPKLLGISAPAGHVLHRLPRVSSRIASLATVPWLPPRRRASWKSCWPARNLPGRRWNNFSSGSKNTKRKSICSFRARPRRPRFSRARRRRPQPRASPRSSA